MFLIVRELFAIGCREGFDIPDTTSLELISHDLSLIE